MNRLVAFIGKFTVFEGLTAAASWFALAASIFAVIYARRSAAAAERSADATIRQAESAERSERHVSIQSRAELMRARVKYREVAGQVVASLNRMQHLLATSKGDEYLSGQMLTSGTLTELRLLSVEAAVELDVESIRPIVDSPLSLLSNSPRFLLADRRRDIERLEEIASLIKRSISQAEREPQT